jgi:hypothetical protein
VIVAGEDQVESPTVEELAIRRTVGVRDGNHHVGAGLAQRRRLRDPRLHGGCDLQVAGARLHRGVVRGEPDDANLDGAKLQHRGVSKSRQRLARRVAKIGGEQRELRLRHAVAEDVRAEIIFVVAGHEDIRPRHVHQADDMGALVEAGQQRRRDGVPGMDEDDVLTGRALRLDGRDYARIAAAPVNLRHLIDIVDQQKRDLDGFRRRRPDEHQQRGEGDGDGSLDSRHGRLLRPVLHVGNRESARILAG